MNVVLFAQCSKIFIDTNLRISTVKDFQNYFSSLKDRIEICNVFFSQILFSFWEIDWFVFHCYKSKFGWVQSFNWSFWLFRDWVFELLKHLVLEWEHIRKDISVRIFYNRMRYYFYVWYQHFWDFWLLFWVFFCIV